MPNELHNLELLTSICGVCGKQLSNRLGLRVHKHKCGCWQKENNATILRILREIVAGNASNGRELARPWMQNKENFGY